MKILLSWLHGTTTNGVTGNPPLTFLTSTCDLLCCIEAWSCLHFTDWDNKFAQVVLFIVDLAIRCNSHETCRFFIIYSTKSDACFLCGPAVLAWLT